eukprot:scaffold1146_cov399-Prasinococcus_capsulatus_cf.AAC.46
MTGANLLVRRVALFPASFAAKDCRSASTRSPVCAWGSMGPMRSLGPLPLLSHYGPQGCPCSNESTGNQNTTSIARVSSEGCHIGQQVVCWLGAPLRSVCTHAAT